MIHILILILSLEDKARYYDSIKTNITLQKIAVFFLFLTKERKLVHERLLMSLFSNTILYYIWKQKKNYSSEF